jgi:hypothetical protein
MKNLSELKPTTMEGIKSLAKQIKRAEGIGHTEALNKAAKQAGHENFAAANRMFTGGQTR